MTSHLHDIKGNIVNLGWKIEDTIPHPRKHDEEDKRFEKYYDHFRSIIRILEYLRKQIDRMGNKLWSRFFRHSLKIGEEYQKLMGANSLHFKDIEKYYSEIDRMQAEDPTPSVHPGEREYVVPGVVDELRDYIYMVVRLKHDAYHGWQKYAFFVRCKVQLVKVSTKHILKLIKKRGKRRSKVDRHERKVNRLMKKKPETSESEKKDLGIAQLELDEAKEQYSSFNESLKLILPHLLSFHEELIENLVSSIVLKHFQVYDDINYMLKKYSTYHGLGGDIEWGSEEKENVETQVSSPRYRIETLLRANHDPNLEFAEVIDNKDHNYSEKVKGKFNKNVSNLQYRHSKRKAMNSFEESLVANPLKSFMEFNDPSVHALGMHYLENFTNMEKEEAHGDAAPPLPSRNAKADDNSNSPPPLPPRNQETDKKNQVSSNRRSSDSSDSLASEEDDFASDISSVSSVSTNGSVTEKTTVERIKEVLRDLYNGSKNDIASCPEPFDLAV